MRLAEPWCLETVGRENRCRGWLRTLSKLHFPSACLVKVRLFYLNNTSGGCSLTGGERSLWVVGEFGKGWLYKAKDVDNKAANFVPSVGSHTQNFASVSGCSTKKWPCFSSLEKGGQKTWSSLIWVSNVIRNSKGLPGFGRVSRTKLVLSYYSCLKWPLVS